MRRPLLAILACSVLAGCAAPPLQSAAIEGLDAPLAALPSSVLAGNAWRDREADAAFDPTDPDHVVVFYNERPEGYLTGAILTDPITPGKLRMALASSRDGGETWSVTRVPLAGTAAPGSKWGAFCAMGDPNVFFDNDGVVHVTLLPFTCGGPALTVVDGVAHATTSDDGATWSEPDIIVLGAGGPAGIFHDRQWGAYDAATGRIGVAWSAINLGRQALTASFSGDGGRSWSLPQEIETNAPLDDGLGNWLLHTTWGPEGRFHIAGVHCGGACFVHYALEPGGEAARSETPTSTCEGVQGVLEYAVSAWTGETLVLAGAPLANDATTCVVASPDGGATWTTAKAFPGTTHPAIATTSTGVALALLTMDGKTATPTLVQLGADLGVHARAPIAEAYLADSDGDGAPEAGDYDTLAVSTEGAALWALTRPNGEGRPSAGDPFDDLDVWAYRAQLEG